MEIGKALGRTPPVTEIPNEKVIILSVVIADGEPVSEYYRDRPPDGALCHNRYYTVFSHPVRGVNSVNGRDSQLFHL
jgi:hypothetical protein